MERDMVGFVHDHSKLRIHGSILNLNEFMGTITIVQNTFENNKLKLPSCSSGQLFYDGSNFPRFDYYT